MVLVKYNKDQIVQPPESSWFGFYMPGQDVTSQPLQQTPLYVNDDLGIRTLDQQGKLVLLEIDSYHLDTSQDFFVGQILPFLTP